MHTVHGSARSEVHNSGQIVIRSTAVTTNGTSSAPMVRSLRLARSDGHANYTLCWALEAWADANTRHVAVSGTASPVYIWENAEPFPWTHMNDGDDGTFAHTAPAANAYFEVDFGQDVPCAFVRVGLGPNPNNPDTRNVQTTLTATNTQGTVIFTYTFDDTTISPAWFSLPLPVGI